VGPVVAKNVAAYFRDPHAAVVDRLARQTAITWPAPAAGSVSDAKLAGKTFVLTGTLQAADREAAKTPSCSSAAGGRQRGRRKRTTWWREHAGSKTQKSPQLGIRCSDEAAFMKC